MQARVKKSDPGQGKILAKEARNVEKSMKTSSGRRVIKTEEMNGDCFTISYGQLLSNPRKFLIGF